MDERERRAVVDRLATNLRERGRHLGERVHARSAAEYAEPALFDSEQRHIFRRLPLVVGHGSQLPNPGDFITVNFAGPPLLIVRGDDGQLRAFINACRHRGAALETAACGHRRNLTCPYHGWSYGLDGALTALTDRESFPDVDLSRLGLQALPVAEQHGLILVQLTPDGAADGTNTLDGAAALGEPGGHFASFDLAAHRHFRTEVIETQFNWKIGVEGALETYHFRYVHPNTASKLFVGMAAIADFWPPHLRFAVAKPSLPGIATARSDAGMLRDQVLMTYLLFPNMLVSFPNDHILLTSFYPRGVAGCSMVYTMLTPPDKSTPEHAAHWERTWKLTRTVLAEDFAIQESIQRGCEAGVDAPLLLSRYEQCIVQFRAACDAALARSR